MRRLLAVGLCALAVSAPCLAGTAEKAGRFETALEGGDVARAAGRWTEAIACYREALQLKPGHAQARFHLASVCREAQQYYEARRNFRLALQANAADRAWVSQCRLQMAACWEATQNYREALVEYRLALEADSDCEQAKSGERRALAQVNASPLESK
jgi:tetratricopeptide (TPR) repeat protein